MDFLKLAQERFSVRKYDARPVEPEKLEQVLEAGRLAPTAVNFQPQRILVLDTPESMDKLKACTPYYFGAPVALLVCYDAGVSWKRALDGADSGAVDASIVGTHMLLEAAAIGLGTVWVGNFDIPKLRAAFGMPEQMEPVALIYLGYAAADCTPSPKHGDRLPLTKTVFWNNMHE